MLITKKHLSRRAVLKGTGVSIALPLLSAMIPAATAWGNTSARPRTRLGFVYFAHGAVMEHWTPRGTGRDFELGRILTPLSDFKDSMTVVSGLRNRAPDEAVSHGLVERTWLTCVPPSSIGTRPDAGVSIDQMAARQIGQETALSSLELTTEPRGGTHSYRTPTQPLPMEYNPRNVFYRLFGPGDSRSERAAILHDTGSILDRVQHEAARLDKMLGGSDREIVSDFLDSVREVERRVQTMQAQDFENLEVPEAPLGVPSDLDAYFDMMFDMMALAYQADLTRVATFQMAMEISMRTYAQIGISEAFHPLSHHGRDPDSLDRLATIQAYHSSAFGRFLRKLAAMPDGDGSILDHSIILYGSNMSDSDKHNNVPLPLAVFGKGNGRVKGGQHLTYPEGTPLANLLVTLLDRADVRVESVGDSTGTLQEV